MAKVQKTMTWVLISSFFMFIIFGLFKLQPDYFDISASGYFSGGGKGFLTAVVLLVYSTTGYWMTINYGGNAKRATKDMPIVLIFAACTILVIYTLAAIVASGILPIADVAGKPLTYVAKAALPLPLFYVFIIGGVIMALATTLNSSFASTARTNLQACADGWLPESLAKLNKNKQPFVLLTLFYAIGILPLIFNLSVAVITNNIVLISYLTTLLPMAAICRLPQKFPEAWKKSRFHVANGMFYAIMSLSIACQIAIIILSAKGLTPAILTINIAAITFCVIYSILRYRSGKVHVEESCEVEI